MEESRHLPATLDSLNPFEVFFYFTDDYLLSNNGRIASIKSGKMKIIKPTIVNGYCQVGIRYSSGVETKEYVHRLISRFFHGEPKDGMVVDHINFVRADCRLENLRLISIHENSKRHSNEGSEAIKKAWKNKNENWRKKSGELLKNKWEDQDFRQRHNKITSKTLSELHKNDSFKKKLSDAIKKRNVEYSSKPVIQYNLDGNFIKEWKSLADIHRELGFKKSSISKCCLGKQKTAYGFIWKYKEVG